MRGRGKQLCSRSSTAKRVAHRRPEEHGARGKAPVLSVSIARKSSKTGNIAPLASLFPSAFTRESSFLDCLSCNCNGGSLDTHLSFPDPCRRAGSETSIDGCFVRHFMHPWSYRSACARPRSTTKRCFDSMSDKLNFLNLLGGLIRFGKRFQDTRTK